MKGPTFIPFSHTTSNSSANCLGFTFKIYLDFYHFSCHPLLICLLSNPSHTLLSVIYQNYLPPVLPASTFENQYDIKYLYCIHSTNTIPSIHIMKCTVLVNVQGTDMNLTQFLPSRCLYLGWVNQTCTCNMMQSNTR